MHKHSESSDTPDLSLRAFAQSFSAEVFHVDSRIMRTLRVLFTRPGQLTRAYFTRPDGKYVQPLKLYFIINFLFFLITPMLNTPQFQVFNFSRDSLSAGNKLYQRMIQEQIQRSGISAGIHEERFDAHLRYNQPAFVFLVIPLFALLLKLLVPRRYYIEHLIFSLHYLSFFLVLLLLMTSLHRVLSLALKSVASASGVVQLVLFGGIVVGLFIYLVVATKAFYENSILPSILKSVLLFVGFVAVMGVYAQFLFFYTLLALTFGA